MPRPLWSLPTLLAVAATLLFARHACLADEAPSAPRYLHRPRFEEAVPRPHETVETLRYIAYLYFGSLGVYLYVSRDEVFNNATLQNYALNLTNLSMFDQDLPSANWGVHLATGAVVYEFFRARSYAKEDAFYLTVAQECLFQFTVETLIFPTGLENIVNTGIVGPILGRGLELASLPLLNSDFAPLRVLGYVLNLPAALGLYENAKVTPVLGRDVAGLQLQARF